MKDSISRRTMKEIAEAKRGQINNMVYCLKECTDELSNT